MLLAEYFEELPEQGEQASVGADLKNEMQYIASKPKFTRIDYKQLDYELGKLKSRTCLNSEMRAKLWVL
jgi:hypothetical protein